VSGGGHGLKGWGPRMVLKALGADSVKTRLDRVGKGGASPSVAEPMHITKNQG